MNRIEKQNRLLTAEEALRKHGCEVRPSDIIGLSHQQAQEMAEGASACTVPGIVICVCIARDAGRMYKQYSVRQSEALPQAGGVITDAYVDGQPVPLDKDIVFGPTGSAAGVASLRALRIAGRLLNPSS